MTSKFVSRNVLLGFMFLTVLASANATTVVLSTPNPQARINTKNTPACVTALTQYAAPAGYSGSSNQQPGITPYTTCSQTVGRYCGISLPMNFTTPANGGNLCPGTYIASGYCVQNTAGGCGGGSCGWSVAIYDLASNNQLAGSSSVSGPSGSVCAHGNPCQNVTVTLQTTSFIYDTNSYSNVYMENQSESAASTSYCAVTMKLQTAY